MRRILKAIAISLFLVFGVSTAKAQCSGNPPAGRLCGNNTASPTLPGWQTMTSMLDRNFGAPSTQGTVLNRGASLWSVTATPSLGLNGGTGGAITLNGSSTGSATIGVKAAAGTVTFNLPITNGTLNQVLITDGSGNTSWTTAGAGTVSSVGLALPASILTVSGSPVTGTGTLTGTLATQSANLVWAGPTTGSAATPTFRSLVGADLPNPSSSSLGGVQSIAAVSHEFVTTISTSGVPSLAQPAFTDISGTLAAAQCVLPTVSAVGCVQAVNAVASNWIRSISTSGVPALSQPNFTDLAGSATLAQLPSISNNSVLGNNSGGTAVPTTLSASNVLDLISNVQGDVIYRSATAWVSLAPGTNGQVLTSAGAAANPTWTTVTGTGTVTSIATGNGITGGTITTTGTLGLANIATGNMLAYTGAGSGVPVATTPSAILDVIGSTEGNILYRGASNWLVLSPGTNGQYLQTTGGGSTPQWANAPTVVTALNGQTGSLAFYQTPQVRLTLTQGTPVTTSDVTAATAVYLEPYNGAQLTVYDGSANWVLLPVVSSTYSLPATQTQSGTTHTNTTLDGLTDTSQMVVGEQVTGTNIAANSVISVINSTTSVTLNNATTGSATNTMTFKLPPSTAYDVYAVNNSGVPKLIWSAAWSGTTPPTRVLQNGVLVKSGATTQRLLGSVYTSATAGVLVDSALGCRCLSNLYNQAPRSILLKENASTWTYSTAAWTEVNNSGPDQVGVMFAVPAFAQVEVNVMWSNSASTGGNAWTGVGVDSTTSPSSTMSNCNGTSVSGITGMCSASYVGSPGIGSHYFSFLIYAIGTNTQTWYGNLGIPDRVQSGISGMVLN